MFSNVCTKKIGTHATNKNITNFIDFFGHFGINNMGIKYHSIIIFSNDNLSNMHAHYIYKEHSFSQSSVTNIAQRYDIKVR